MLALKLFCYSFLIRISLPTEIGPIVKVANGAIRGVYMTSRNGRPFKAFLGIPYALAPERFEPPKHSTDWVGVKNTTTFGSRCAQVNVLDSQTPQQMGSEDCLFINVFTALPYTGRFPVIVVIETGGFLMGYSDHSGPKYFMDEDVVLVTFNYRIGAFGFLSTRDEVVPGNMGLKDQNLALQWVQKNINYLGGDRNKVTIMGESSGGASVSFHLLSPLSRGLFKYAIAQSGSALNVRSFTADLSSDTKKFAQKLGCTTENSKEMVDCLKKLPLADIRDGIFEEGNILRTEKAIFTPTLERHYGHQKYPPFLTESPEKLLREGRFQKSPLIMTLTKDEGLLRFSALVQKSPALLKELSDDWLQVAPTAFHYRRQKVSDGTKNFISTAIRDFYFGPKNIISKESFENLTAVYSDSFIMSSVKRHALYHARYAPVFTAVLAYPGVWSQIFNYGYTSPIGVGHSDELQYLFNNNIYPPFPSGSLPELVSRYFVRLWTNFATYGNPQFIWGNITWTPLSRQEIHTGDINWLYMKDRPEHMLEPLRSRLKFWDLIQEIFKNESSQYNNGKMTRIRRHGLKGNASRSTRIQNVSVEPQRRDEFCFVDWRTGGCITI